MEDVEHPERYPVEGTPIMVERLSRGRWGATHSAGMPCGHAEWTDPMRAATSLLAWWISLSDNLPSFPIEVACEAARTARFDNGRLAYVSGGDRIRRAVGLA